MVLPFQTMDYDSNELSQLDDVVVENPVNNDAIVYEDGIWKNKPITSGGGSFPSGSLGDVIISDGANGLSSTNTLSVNPANGDITGTFLNVNSNQVKMASNAGSGAGNDTISIGWNSGANAGNFSIAVGAAAGSNSGTNSVSLGYEAQGNDNNCIVINGTGILTQSQQTDSCYINPLRNQNATTIAAPYVVQYNDLYKEVIKSEDLHVLNIVSRGTLSNDGTASLFSGQLTIGETANRAIIGSPSPILSVDLQNRRVGINVENPTEDLDIDGNIQLNSATTSKIVFYDSNDAHEHAEIDATDDGTNGGQLQLHTKVDGGAVTEKLRINNIGAFGIGGANYGTPGQVLTSNGAVGSVSWEDAPAGGGGATNVYSRIKTPVNQSIANGALIQNYDDANAVTSQAGLVSQTTPFTAPRNGDYFIHAHLTAKASINNDAVNRISVMRVVRFRSGVETNIVQSNHEPGTLRNHSISTIETLQTGDTLGIRVFNDSGENITISASNSSTAFLVKSVD